MESIRQSEEPGNDWKELQGLKEALLFETLRLMLLVSIMIVRGLTKGITWWLDKEASRILELGHKEGQMST